MGGEIEDSGEELTLTEQLSSGWDAAVDNSPDESAGDLAGPVGTHVEDAATEEAVAEMEAPQHWSDSDKTLFAGQPREVQQFMLDRHKAMEGDYTRKSMEVADFRRTWEPVQDIFAPYEQELRASGTSPGQLVNQWAGTYLALQNDPAGTLRALANQYGVDLAADDEGYTDPVVGNLQQQLHQLQNSMAQREQMEYASKQAAIESTIHDFKEMKTEAGELAHPYFDDVMEDMLALASAERAAGRNPEIHTLYEIAVWMNPSLRERQVEAQLKAAEEKRKNEARQKAEAARRAGTHVTGSPGGAVPSEDLDLRDQIANLF